MTLPSVEDSVGFDFFRDPFCCGDAACCNLSSGNVVEGWVGDWRCTIALPAGFCSVFSEVETLNDPVILARSTTGVFAARSTVLLREEVAIPCVGIRLTSEFLWSISARSTGFKSPVAVLFVTRLDMVSIGELFIAFLDILGVLVAAVVGSGLSLIAGRDRLDVIICEGVDIWSGSRRASPIYVGVGCEGDNVSVRIA